MHTASSDRAHKRPCICPLFCVQDKALVLHARVDARKPCCRGGGQGEADRRPGLQGATRCGGQERQDALASSRVKGRTKPTCSKQGFMPITHTSGMAGDTTEAPTTKRLLIACFVSKPKHFWCHQSVNTRHRRPAPPPPPSPPCPSPPDTPTKLSGQLISSDHTCVS